MQCKTPASRGRFALQRALFSNTRPVAGGELSDLKHTKVHSSRNPTEFYGPRILPRQGNDGVESSFQTPLAAQFDVQLRFYSGDRYSSPR